MGSDKEFDDSAIVWGVLLIVGIRMLQDIEDSSSIILGYQILFRLATSRLRVIIRKLLFQPYFDVFYVVKGEKLQNIED